MVGYTDGTRIVTASSDNTARVWDSTSGKTLYTLKGHTSDVNHAAFSPDGTRTVTASSDNTALVWEYYSTVDLVDKFKRLNLSPLTKEERRLYFLD